MLCFCRHFDIIVCLTESNSGTGAIQVWPEAVTEEDVEKINENDGQTRYSQRVLTGTPGTIWIANNFMVRAHRKAKCPTAQYLTFRVTRPSGLGYTQSPSKTKTKPTETAENKGGAAQKPEATKSGTITDTDSLAESLWHVHVVQDLVKTCKDDCDATEVTQQMCDQGLTELPPGTFCMYCGKLLDGDGTIFRDQRHKCDHFERRKVSGSTRMYGWCTSRREHPSVYHARVAKLMKEGDGGTTQAEPSESGAEQVDEAGGSAEQEAAAKREPGVGSAEQGGAAGKGADEKLDEDVGKQDGEEGDVCTTGGSANDMAEVHESKHDGKEVEVCTAGGSGDKKVEDDEGRHDEEESVLCTAETDVTHFDTSDAEAVEIVDDFSRWENVKSYRMTDTALVKKFFPEAKRKEGAVIVTSIRETIRQLTEGTIKLGELLVKASKMMTKKKFADFVQSLGRQPRQVAWAMKFARLRDDRWRVQHTRIHALRTSNITRISFTLNIGSNQQVRRGHPKIHRGGV